MPRSEDHGFRPIGNPTKQIASSLSNGGMTPTNCLPSSETTGSASPVRTRLSSIGRALGETAAGNVVGLRQMVATGHQPRQTDLALLASLAPLVALSSKCDWLTEDLSRIGEIIGYGVTDELVDGGLCLARECVEAAFQPMPVEDLVSELARLRTLTISRNMDGEDMTAMLSAYADALSCHPADCVRSVLRGWGRSNKFWPALAELENAIGAACSERRMIGRAVDQARRGNFAERERGQWPSWLESIWGPTPDGPRARQEAFGGAGGV